MSLLLAMNVHFQFVVLVMNMSKRMGTSVASSARLDTKGTKVVYFVHMLDGDEYVDEVDDLENEFSYGQGKAKARPQWDEDADISSSSRREQPIPLLTHRHQISSETAIPDTQSARTTSGPLGPSDKVHSLPYVDQMQPVPEKNVVHVNGSRYNEGKGDIEGTGSNGEELQNGNFVLELEN
ncbi:Cellulose synthase A catalytic subunit 1 [UDP-forming] [Arachis hypogaea]|nr:Cellulose synthase A catalytic subunit 1 [UDP-forming] [Arachis hypogaea]